MRSCQFLELLRAFESRNVTAIESDGSWPIVWERARGVDVWDADGKKYLDLTAAFGVAAAGHANPRVVKAGQKQMARLLHAMGDVHPHESKGRLAKVKPFFAIQVLRLSKSLSTPRCSQRKSAA